MINWNRYANFSREEFLCSHCGEEGISESLVAKLQQLRGLYGKPIYISSGYRCPQHPVEAAKTAPGAHATGVAVDILVDREDAYKLLKLALDLNFQGIGIQQKGTGRFIHLDIGAPGLIRPTIWSY